MSVIITKECGEYESLMNFVSMCDIQNVSECYALGPSIFAEESTTGSILMCHNCVSWRWMQLESLSNKKRPLHISFLRSGVLDDVTCGTVRSYSNEFVYCGKQCLCWEKHNLQSNLVITSWEGPNKLCRFKCMSLSVSGCTVKVKEKYFKKKYRPVGILLKCLCNDLF
jgi:hypothetical protein